MDFDSIPCITTEQMVEVDRLMVEEYGIKLIQMMENAGRQLARLSVEEHLDRNPAGKVVLVLAGSGGNGGGALVCARNLHNWGADVEVVLSKPVSGYSGVIRAQVEILKSYPLQIHMARELKDIKIPDLIIDGIIGYSLEGAPRGVAAEMINWANQKDCPILALDVPSGLDASTGEAFSPAIHAATTMTLALPKTGLKLAGKMYVGKLYLADIGVPPELYASSSLGLSVGPIFKQEEIIHLADLND